MLGSTMGTAIKEISEMRCSGGEESHQIIYWQWLARGVAHCGIAL